MADTFTGQGCTITFSNDGFATDNQIIPCVIGFTLPGSDTEQIDITCIADAVKNFQSSRQREMGDFTFSCQYDPHDAVYARLEADKIAGVELDWKVTFIAQGGQASVTELTFKGAVSSDAYDEVTAEAAMVKNYTVKTTTAISVGTA